MGGLRKSVFSMNERSLPPYWFSFRRAGPQATSWANLIPNPKHFGGATGCQKLSTTFWTLSRRVKVHLLLRYLSIGVAYGVLLNLFWTFEYVTAAAFAGLLSADFSDVKKLTNFL